MNTVHYGIEEDYLDLNDADFVLWMCLMFSILISSEMFQFQN